METLLEKTPIEPVPFSAWFETLTDKEKAQVQKARRAGLIVIKINSDGLSTVGKVV